MSVMRQKFLSYADMPEGLRNFLFTKDFSDAEKDLQASFGLTDEQRNLIGDQVMDTVFGDTALGVAIAAIKTALVPSKLDEKKWQDFLGLLLKRDFWAIRDLFGDELTRVMDENQVSTAGWPDAKVYLKPMTYSAAASEVAARGGFSLLGPQSRERLRELIMSKVKGMRIDAQVKEVLMRPADFGGLGLDANSADKTIQAMNDIIASVKVMSEDEYADWLADEARKKIEAETRAKEIEAKSAEDKEIEAIKAKLPQAQPATVLDAMVEKAYAGLTWKPTDEYLTKRLRHIISSRLRDVRSAFEVEQLLQRDSKVGGVGLDKDLAHDLSKQIETAYIASHDQVLAEEKQKIEQQLVEQRIKIEERKKREAEEHAKWYQEKILARKQEEEQKKKIAEQMKQSFLAGSAAQTPAAATLPVDIKEAQKEKERFGEMVPAVVAGAAPITTAPAAKDASVTPFALPTAPVQAARPEVKISKETIVKQPLAAGLKPRVDDVKYEPRLISLVDELRSISLAEFRRLAKDPQAAADKIYQKLETLGEESFEKRTQGIMAWQSSPIQQSYLSLLGEALKQGKSVQEVADAKRAAGQDSLTPAEIAAVISLNSRLHY